MAFRALRPTGDSIVWQHQSAPRTLQAGYHCYWVNCGTAALALALIAACAERGLANPEVILPTYGCPDLIAAAHFAGAKAVLVDLRTDSPDYDHAQLQDAINNNTVAVVAATLLGIRTNPDTMRDAIGTRPVSLVEDSAQWFPRNAEQAFFGDHVVISFGRGKPVNLLSGGALLSRHPLPAHVCHHIASDESRLTSRIKYAGKLIAYNLLIHPLAYGIVERLPLLQLGATAYHALDHICAMEASAHELLNANLLHFSERDLQVQARWKNAVKSLQDPDIIDLAESHAVPRDDALLRYPLLIKSSERRNRVYTALNQRGLGASIMYPDALFNIVNVSKIAHAGEHARLHAGQQNALLLAQHLLTLPTHRDTTPAIIEQTLDVLRSSRNR
jgi:dTDP-4-amino-4,6-dideoxygalactose transaminase